jgi:hypothetical protein
MIVSLYSHQRHVVFPPQLHEFLRKFPRPVMSMEFRALRAELAINHLGA